MVIYIACLVAAGALNLLAFISSLAVGALLGKVDGAENMTTKDREVTKTAASLGLYSLVASYALVVLCVIDLAKA